MIRMADRSTKLNLPYTTKLEYCAAIRKQKNLPIQGYLNAANISTITIVE